MNPSSPSRVRVLLCLGALLSIFALPLKAGEAPEWTVEDLVRRALEHNAELRFYEAEVGAAQGKRTQAGLWKNPEFSGEYGERRIKDSSGRLQDEGTTRSFSLAQTFEFPGKGSLRKAIAAKDIELAELGLGQFRRVLEGKVRSLVVRYQGASANADAADEIHERSAGLVKLLQSRPMAGTRQLLELRVIEGSLMEIQQASKEFVLEREEARIELNALLGFPAGQPLKIKTPLRPPQSPMADLNTLVLAGLSGNLPLKIRTVELEKAVKEVSAARLEAAPDFVIGPFFSRDQAGEREENIGGTLSVTLPLWNWNQGNIAASRARRDQADALLLEARRRVEAEIARRYRAYALTRQQLERIPESVIGNLREAADLADRQYRTGAVDVQLFLEVQREFLNAQKIRHAAVSDAWNHWLDLGLLTGGSGTEKERVP